MAVRVGRLKRRADYLRVARARRKWAARGLVLQVRRRRKDEATDAEAAVRVGLTASRKVGKAVARNRARRRLRALAEKVLPGTAEKGHDYVLIARPATLTRDFGHLVRDLEEALRRLRVYRPERRSGHRPEDRKETLR